MNYNKLYNKQNYNFFFLKKKNIINFFLLDGPPFANDNIHIGHIFNKMLKNLIIKFFFSKNYILLNNYGWDCHGLPIEQNIFNKKYFFIKCRSFVCKNIKLQKKSFISFNFFNTYCDYNSMEPYYESYQIKIFQYLILKNIILEEEIPIFWCFKCSSSLSYSEIIYKENNLYSFYFKIKINIFYLILWTTTIWTLLNHQTCFLLKKNIYVIFNSNNIKAIFIEKLIYKLLFFLNLKGKIISFIYSYYLNKNNYLFFFNKILKIYNFYKKLNFNFLLDKKIGTGIIHCSPSNGPEDYIFFKNKKNIKNFLNNKCFFKILSLFKKINFFFINKILYKFLIKRKIIIKKIEIFHKNMFCWRHKNIIIYFLSKQIFLNLNFIYKKYNIKYIIINNIKKIFFFPNYLKNILINMILLRNNWCISRQRYWGVYIYYKKNNLKINSFLKNLCRTFTSHIFKYFNLLKNINIFDVWLDSSIISLFYNNFFIIIEGKDQIRGWYQSIIIMNILVFFIFKIKTFISHSFCVDKKKRKFSKSLKNFINIKNLLLKYNKNIIFLYLLEHNIEKNIIFDIKIINNTINLFNKINNFIKFIFNNFYYFSFKKNQIIFFDNIIILKIFVLNKLIKKMYLKNYYYKIINIIEFFIIFLNNFYFKYIKYNLYICKKNSLLRNSVIFVLKNILDSLINNLFPIINLYNEKVKKYKIFFIKNNFFFFLKFNKKFNNNINIIFCKKYKIVNFFELTNLLNCVIILKNFFWFWNIKKKIEYFIFKKYCYFSKNMIHINYFIYKKKICYKCCLNSFYNLEEIRFYA